MKKILVLGMSSTLGGVETYIYNLIKNLDRQKYYFDFLIVGDEKSVFENEINELLNDHKNHFFYAPNLKKNFFKANLWLKKFYKKNKYDAIYMNTCTAARIKYCEIAVKKYKIPLIAHSHSGNATLKVHILTNKLYRKHITKLSTVKLACSDKAYKWLFTDKVSDDRIVPNGVDTTRFFFSQEWRDEVRKELNIKGNNIVIGNVGRFSPQKNQNYFIELCKKTKKEILFLIIGDGELKQFMEERIKVNNFENRFIILSARNNIEKYYSAMDIFAMPSNFEGLPIVAIEAQAGGLPCILSTNISKQTSLSKYCKFVELEKIDEWIKTINEFSGIRYNGTEIIEQKGFNHMKSVEKISKVFENL